MRRQLTAVVAVAAAGMDGPQAAAAALAEAIVRATAVTHDPGASQAQRTEAVQFFEQVSGHAAAWQPASPKPAWQPAVSPLRDVRLRADEQHCCLCRSGCACVECCCAAHAQTHHPLMRAAQAWGDPLHSVCSCCPHGHRARPGGADVSLHAVADPGGFHGCQHTGA